AAATRLRRRARVHHHSARAGLFAGRQRHGPLHRRGASAMTRKAFWVFIVIGLVLAGVATARAGGFAVAEQSAVAGGTAGASTARSDDAGAAWYNPAALTDGGGLRLGAGFLAAMPSLHAE